MPSPPTTGPLAVDLDVLKLGTTEDPVSRDDVERALYALTGWQQPQALVDAALAVVDSYATSVALGVVVPRRDGHGQVACHRAHLDGHACPKPAAVLPVVTTCVSCLAQVEPTVNELVDATVATAHLAAVAARDTRALDQASQTTEPGKRVRTGVRNEPTMTPGELLLVDDLHVDELTEAQRAARHTLMTRSQGCSTCGRVKSLDEFYRDKARLTGHASRCKDCANAATAARRRKDA